MTFLAPLFFVALAGLAIPVLLHLTQKEKKEVVYFPSLMFVRKIPYQASRRRRIQHWFLLMLRLAALALIVLAFARPLLTRPDAPVALGQGAREVVVLLDTSYSMGYGPRWQAAVDAARNVVSGLGPSDRASIVTFGSGTDILLRNTSEHGALNSAIAAAKPGASATRYAPALKVAGSLLAESQLPRREAVLISDFQRSGWRGQEGAALPAGATLTPVAIQGVSDKPNLSVTAVSLQRSLFANQERVAVTAGITNRSERPVTGQSVRLEAGGLTVATKTFNVEGGASTSVSFDPVTIGGRNFKGTVRLGDDALIADNSFNFVVSPSEPVHVVLVDRGGGSSGLYVSQALAIGDSPKFNTVTRQPESLTDDDLKKTSLVVLNDVPVPSPLGRRLLKFVEGGGGLLIAAGARATWPRDVDLLPASIGNPVDRTRGDAARIGGIEFGHPVFEAFRAPRSGDFSSVRVYGYRNAGPVMGAQVLARFDAGAPAVIERRVGAGRVLLWASTFDQSWTDLPVKSVFLPFVHRAATHLVAYVPSQPWATVGQILDTSLAGAHKGQSVPTIALTPAGKRLPVGGEGTEVIEIEEQGFYELRGDNNPNDVAVVAANVDPAEADLTALDPQDIVAASTGETPSDGVPNAAVPQTPETREKSQRLWWYLLCLGVALLAVETLVSNRFTRV